MAPYNWHDVLFFLELSRQGQLVDAAKRLKVDYTTVGRRIRDLEAALNCKLFRRTKSGFMPTEIGMKILQYAESMEFGANAIAQIVGNKEMAASGPVRVATMEGIGSFYFAPRFGRFMKDHPSVVVELVTAPRWINLSKREADIFISFSKPSERRLAVRKVGEFRAFLYASGGYLKQMGEPRSLADLDKHDFVDYIDDLIEIPAVRWLHDVAVPRRVVFRSSSLVAQYNSAAAGVGIAMLPTFMSSHNKDLRRVLPAFAAKREVWLSIHRDLEHVTRIDAVVRFIARIIEADRDLLMGA